VDFKADDNLEFSYYACGGVCHENSCPVLEKIPYKPAHALDCPFELVLGCAVAAANESFAVRAKCAPRYNGHVLLSQQPFSELFAGERCGGDGRKGVKSS